MQVTVFVERLDEQTCRAETTQPIMLVTEGRTREVAFTSRMVNPLLQTRAFTHP